MPATHDPAAHPAAAPPAGSADPTAAASRRGRAVGVIVGAVVACAFVMVGFIWYRWQAVREPTTAVIVTGDARFAGTVVTVTGPRTLPTERTITTELTPHNNFVAPVLLEPGWYRVTAVLRGHRLLEREDVEVRRFLGVRFQLDKLVRPPPPDPSTQPAAAADNR